MGCVVIKEEFIESIFFTSKYRRITMKCPRCKGKMFAEKFYDFVRSYDAWKCCSCGEMLDPTIVANRVRNQYLYIG
jgi:hypothetical protein